MGKKTIALIGENFGGTGKGLYPVEISKSINRISKKYKVKLFMRDAANYNSRFTVKVKTFKTKLRIMAGLGYYIPLLLKLKKDKSIDLIHAYDEKTNLVATLLKKPVVTTVCDMYPIEVNRFPMKNFFQLIYKLLDRCDQIVTISKNTADKLIKRFPNFSEKVTPIHLGVDINRFKPDYKNSRKIITIGILCSEDEKLVGVFEKILLEYGDKVKIILGGRDVPEKFNQLKSFPNVSFRGFIKESQLPKHYQDIDIFVYDTNIAAFELIPVEAMSSGCAVVVSNVGALPEVINGGGILANNTEEGFYNSIKKLLDNRNLMSEYQKKGRKRGEQLTWDICAKKYMQVYDKVLPLS
jgi:glycosyltransferase involved in cell wall biosynthesis